MEKSLKKASGVEIPKRKSLDLKSLYNPRVSNVGVSKKQVSEENVKGDVKKRKRKSGTEGSLSCLESDTKKSRKRCVDGAKSEPSLILEPSGGSKLLHGISFSFGKDETAFNIPKRPRGLVGRKRMIISQLSKPLELSNSDDHVGTINVDDIDEADPNDQLVKFVTHPAAKVGSSNSKSAGDVSGSKCKLKQKADSKPIGTVSSSNPKLKRKGGADEVKKSRTDRSSSVLHAEKEDNLVVNNGGASSKKRRSNGRKNKDLVTGGIGSKSSTKKSEPAVGGTKSDFVPLLDVDDDDEENLEQNAARMLSSRFDPSCTGFSTKKSSSVPQTANGFSNPVSPVRDSFNQQNNPSAAVESASVDKSRELRPKEEDKNKGVSRKRRHFYEILPKDLDACWFLNRRIKVFWPLDESWYFGLVNDYHPECKLHHIKYDDRDEEWVDLNEEKFKLLLLPDEVPGKRKPKKKSTGNKDVQEGKNVPPSDNDSSTGNNLDTEPIASWLARSSRRLKSLPKSLKKQRTSQVHLPAGSQLPSEKADNSNIELSDTKRASTKPECKSDQSLVHLNEGSSLLSEKIVSNPKFAGFKRSRNEPDRQSVSTNKILVHGRYDQSLLRITSSFENGKHVVYVRKKSSRQSNTSSFVSRDVKSYGKAACFVTVGPATGSLPTIEKDKFDDECLDFYKQLCLIDEEDKLKLDIVLPSKACRLQLCLPLLPFLERSFGTADFWLLHNILMLQCGSLVTTSPAVVLEMLFIDGNLGLRLLLFEGCLMQALAFVFLILIVFIQPHEQPKNDMQLPVTSIRFRLSSVQDLRKQHIFAVCSYSKLQSSKWRYLDSKLMQHCRLINQLPDSECTDDNMKKLECGNSKQCKPRVGLKLSSSEGCEKIFVPGISPMGLSRESCNTRTRLSACSLDATPGAVPQFGLSFSVVPTFFPSWHTFPQVKLQQSNSQSSPEWLKNGSRKVGGKHTLFQPRSINVEDIIAKDKIEMGTEASALKGLSSCEQGLGTDPVLASDVVEKVDSSENLQKRNLDAAGSAGCFKEFKENTCEVIAQPLQGKGVISRQTSDVVGCIENDGFVHSPNPTGSISSWQCSSSSISSPLADFSSLSRDGKTNFMQNGFSTGPKKPRTQVQYTLPTAGYEFNSKQKMQNHRVLPCKRIRRASLRRISDGSKNDKKNLELLACGANVLVTHGDKGWRECGAHIFLEVADHNEWTLAVKLLGITKYSYKVKHILQPGSTNRYSHAMMWKGGNDWVLEFPDRSQWTLFKEMHEECYNRNIRAASVKHIPIPGVWLVEERNDCGTEVPFVRNSTKYFRQVQNDVEMAMDPSCILYDLDTDDEQWLVENKNGTDILRCEEICDEFLEKTIDMFEKVSYFRHRENFTDVEIEELVIGVGSLEAAKVVYEYWRQKRDRKGMPLIRHLQPPLWDRYQQQLKKWELTVGRGNGASSVTPSEKPPMFAFCLKPRGLDIPNKGSKQRSHRKFSVSGHHHTTSGDRDSPLGLGRRSNGHAFGDEKVLKASSVRGTSDVSPSLQASTRVLSPPDEPFLSSTNVSEGNRNSKAYKHKPTKPASQPSFNNQQMVPHNQRTIGNRNGVQQLNTGFPISDFHELRLRDASRAAQHALKMAKLKREKAQRLFAKADLAIHKAVVALMTAEAIEAVDESSNGVN